MCEFRWKWLGKVVENKKLFMDWVNELIGVY